jgi:alkanesulfonate monooxygenase SsuD/methylene tetrahydromethanopterin reductase-like flavin-dependent oxidoreductase (luciferase family)
MKFGLMLPNKGRPYGDGNLLVELALSAEQAGWEGFFLWDHIGGGGDSPTMDPWLCLGAIASQTQNMRLGPMVTPLSRRRPWKVAREIVTLDHLSNGRAVLGVGLGDMVNKDFKAFGETTKPRVRSEMLDESLEIIAGLQSGRPFHYSGKHYQVSESLFKPPAIQSPHIPVWVAARWPFKRPLQRAARWDGVLPRQWNAGPITPAVIHEIAVYTGARRTVDTPFEICKYGLTEGKDLARDRALVKEFNAAGATWWIEEIFSSRGTPRQIQARIAAGPPR